MSNHTASETRKRIRAIGSDLKKALRLPTNAGLYIQQRELPQFSTQPPMSYAEARLLSYPDGDNRVESYAVSEADATPHGAVLHLDFYVGTGYNRQLHSSACVWLGTATNAAKVIDVGLTRYVDTPERQTNAYGVALPFYFIADWAR